MPPRLKKKPSADASYTDTIGQACVVLTADCLPVLLCNQNGSKVAAAHAGWRGLCSGILRKTLACFSTDETVLAYLGPAIGPQVLRWYRSSGGISLWCSKQSPQNMDQASI